MAVKIYDSSAGAFKDAPTPQIYDASTQAYKESTGLVYDTSKGAWDERWGSDRLWLYEAGNEYAMITGGWEEGYVYPSRGTIIKNSDNISMNASSRTAVYLETIKKINLSTYKTLKIVGYFSSTGSKAGLHVAIANQSKRPLGECTRILSNAYTGQTVSEITIDITNYDSTAYIVLGLGTSTTQYSSVTMKISKIWLEK